MLCFLSRVAITHGALGGQMSPKCQIFGESRRDKLDFRFRRRFGPRRLLNPEPGHKPDADPASGKRQETGGKGAEDGGTEAGARKAAHLGPPSSATEPALCSALRAVALRGRGSSLSVLGEDERVEYQRNT